MKKKYLDHLYLERFALMKECERYIERKKGPLPDDESFIDMLDELIKTYQIQIVVLDSLIITYLELHK